jgi:hypothetical protein
LQARLESRYQPIKDATLGLIFMGTPHRGSDKAIYSKVLANVAQFVSHRPPARLLSALQTNSDILSRLTTDFRKHLFAFPYTVILYLGLRSLIHQAGQQTFGMVHDLRGRLSKAASAL